jgi:heme-degrading monooxygenase HmoA
MLVVIWKYEIQEHNRAAFEELYGQAGKWVQLFENGAGYIATELVKDVSQPTAYVTIDTWSSQEKYETFLEEHEEECANIDAEGDGLVISETKIGWFEG